MLRSTRFSICLLAALATGAGVLSATASLAQDGPPPPGAYDDRDGPPPGAYDDRGGPPPNVRPGPPVGYDAGYDYGVANDPAAEGVDPYYQYQGPPPRDPRAHEQYGLRHYVLPVTPRTPYYAGVRLYGDYGYGYGGYGYGGYGYGSRGYGYGCGCAYYGRRYSVYYDDFGIRGASYRGYGDHRRDDYGRGYGD